MTAILYSHTLITAKLMKRTELFLLLWTHKMTVSNVKRKADVMYAINVKQVLKKNEVKLTNIPSEV